MSKCNKKFTHRAYIVSQKGPLYFYQKLRQILTDFRNSFTVEFIKTFATNWLWTLKICCYTTLWNDIWLRQRHFYIYIKTIHSTSLTNKMPLYDEFQTQVTKTVQNVSPSHGHRHEVVNATGQSRRRWCFAPDCLTCQSNAASDRQRLAPSPNKHSPVSYPTPCHQQDNEVWLWDCMWDSFDPRERTICGLVTVAGGRVQR